MIIIYEKITKAQLRKDVKKATKLITDWFDANPKRRVCRAKLWYGDVAHIKRNDIQTGMDAAMAKALPKCK